MADAAFGPVIFNGSISQDAKIWLDSLQDFMAYRELSDEKGLALFKLRLGDQAKDWLQNLPENRKDTFVHLSTAFLERFQPRSNINMRASYFRSAKKSARA